MRSVADPRIAALDGLRALACLVVFIAHNRAPQWFITATVFGKTGVMIFFALSGFLMAYHYMPERSTLKYWLAFLTRRFMRIYPAFAFSLVVMWAIGSVTLLPFFARYSSDVVLDHLFLSKGYDVYWSIPPEIKFYFLFPVIAVVLGLVPAHLRLWLAGTCWFGTLYFTDAPKLDILSLSGYLSCFLSGIAAALIYKNYDLQAYLKPYVWNTLLLICLIAIFTAIPHMFIPSSNLDVWTYSPFFSPLMSLLLLATISATGVFSWVFINPASRFLGKISYSFYLIHITIINRPPSFAGEYTSLRVLNFIITIAVAYLMYRWVELPGNRFGKYFAAKIESLHP